MGGFKRNEYPSVISPLHTFCSFFAAMEICLATALLGVAFILRFGPVLTFSALCVLLCA